MSVPPKNPVAKKWHREQLPTSAPSTAVGCRGADFHNNFDTRMEHTMKAKLAVLILAALNAVPAMAAAVDHGVRMYPPGPSFWGSLMSLFFGA
jgi:hypothetical protein